MALAAETDFSLRDWFGLMVGISWGLVLGCFFASDNMTGPWLVILFGPPVILLISPRHPILSWQLPIGTATVAGTFMNRSSGDSVGGAFADVLLLWFLCSLLSSPWALMFHYRMRQIRRHGRTLGFPIAYVGMVLVVFVCCALTLLGMAATMYPVNDAQSGAWPWYGFLAATAGIILSMGSERVARKLEVQKLVRGVFELLMLPGVILGIAEIVGLFWSKSSGHSPQQSAVCGILVGMEALAAMIWLTRMDRWEQKSTAQS
jgi:hypothetical protein